MLLQIQDGAQALTLRGGLQKMAAEGLCTGIFSRVSEYLATSLLRRQLLQAPSKRTSEEMA